MIKVGIVGATGKMGKRLISLLQEEAVSGLQLAAAFVRPKSQNIGQGVRDTISYEVLTLEGLKKIDVLIDYSSPDAVKQYSEIVRELKIPLIIGTTGLSDRQKGQASELAKSTPLILAPNTSIGINVLSQLVKKAAQLLPSDFLTHISETHHIHKKDAPSGTALQLKDAVKTARPEEKIQIDAIRAGDVVGEHTVTFYGFGERIELTHRALSRDIFAKGALQAAKWLTGKEPKLYQMNDVLEGNQQ